MMNSSDKYSSSTVAQLRKEAWRFADRLFSISTSQQRAEEFYRQCIQVAGAPGVRLMQECGLPLFFEQRTLLSNGRGVNNFYLVKTLEIAEDGSIYIDEDYPETAFPLFMYCPEYGAPKLICQLTEMLDRELTLAFATIAEHAHDVINKNALCGATGKKWCFRELQNACSNHEKMRKCVQEFERRK